MTAEGCWLVSDTVGGVGVLYINGKRVGKARLSMVDGDYYWVAGDPSPREYIVTRTVLHAMLEF